MAMRSNFKTCDKPEISWELGRVTSQKSEISFTPRLKYENTQKIINIISVHSINAAACHNKLTA